ncbi:uncharacterized protein LOC123452854 isoform X2 [Hordeum vulgare subsp. vulgare]|uniref:uncharacterized protein LOC123452854 isoform X2 n=1 Tax=Hordeum vulgare subsp. vulgare TaxID=112509 RepID=UPI001D1A5754|nr:uncharacterized protein LOC123452854 isoform X2 [Hordeum vulgare subsp. vulgare]
MMSKPLLHLSLCQLPHWLVSLLLAMFLRYTELSKKDQGKLCDKWLGMQTCALAMSLGLLPYMGRDGLFKDKETFSDNCLWRINLFFKVWWGLVAFGVPCSLYGRYWIEVQYARLSAHLAILGLTVLVGYFSQWILAIDATNIMTSFLAIMIGGFILFFIRCCVTGDL